MIISVFSTLTEISGHLKGIVSHKNTQYQNLYLYFKLHVWCIWFQLTNCNWSVWVAILISFHPYQETTIVLSDNRVLVLSTSVGRVDVSTLNTASIYPKVYFIKNIILSLKDILQSLLNELFSILTYNYIQPNSTKVYLHKVTKRKFQALRLRGHIHFHNNLQNSFVQW